MTVTCDETTYYYATNLQGDVTAILDATGTAVAQYTYDAWGNPLSTTVSNDNTIGETNSLRYPGYCYDTETGFYYLQSRYYDPTICRFINADAFVSTGQGILGYNMFAYCDNNPIMRTDSNGLWGLEWQERLYFGLALIAVGVAVVLALPSGGGSLVVGGAVLSTTALYSAGAAAVVVGTAVAGEAIAEPAIMYAKQSRQSNKERSTDHPGWVSQSDIDPNRSAQQNAADLLNEKYGIGNWKKGPNTEFNQIVKWINRSLRVLIYLWLELSSEDKS